MKTLWGFGDSWGIGWGIDPAGCYTQLVGNQLELPVKNLSIEGASMGHILYTFLDASVKFKPSDLVLVTLPPDTRGYRIYPGHALSIFSTEPGGEISPEYVSMLEHIDYSAAWFEWHHSIFQNTIISQCQEKQVTLLMQHNYGELRIIDPLRQTCKPEYYVDQNASMAEWLGGLPWDGYTLTTCGPNTNVMTTDLFLDNDTHPNEQGHKIIAHRILERFNEIRNK